MAIIKLPADVKHLYLDEVAHLIADYLNPKGPNDPDGVRYELDKIQAEGEAHQAAKDGLLPIRHPGTHGPFPMALGLTRAVVLVRDFIAYVADRGISVQVQTTDQTEAATPASDAPAHTDATPAPVAASDGPAPLTTGDIAHCFNGLRWSESEWRRPLGDKPVWLSGSVAIPGRRGVSETRWNPVSIGAALVQQRHATPRNVRAKFQTVNLLKPWLDAWKTYEADNFDSE
jgi:hypothetical protein